MCLCVGVGISAHRDKRVLHVPGAVGTGGCDQADVSARN